MAKRCNGCKGSSKRGTGGRETYSWTANSAIVVKVRTEEEQVEVRGSLKEIWCKGSKDTSIDETDNGVIPRRWYSAKAARSRAKEVRAGETDS